MSDSDNSSVGAVRNPQDVLDGDDTDEQTFTKEDRELMAEAQQEMTTVSDSEQDVIRMEHTVDVSEMGHRDKEAIGQLADLYEDCFAEVVAKNRDYSWSFLRTGQKLADTPATPFDDPVRAQVFGLLTRLGDKHERLTENIYGNGDAAVSDDPATTAMEAANYYLFIAFALQNHDLASTL